MHFGGPHHHQGINDGDGNGDKDDKEPKEPTQRAATVAKAAAGVGTLLVGALWLAGATAYAEGDISDYLKAEVSGYTWTTSLFDVFLVVACVSLIVFVLYGDVLRFKQKAAYRAAALLLPFGALVFYAVKLGMMVAEGGEDGNDGLSHANAGKAFAASILSMSIVFTSLQVGAFFFIPRMIREWEYYETLKEATAKADVEEGVAGATPNKKVSSASLKRLFSLIKDEWQMITIGMMALLVSTLTNLALPYIIGVMVDSLVSETNAAELLAQSVVTLIIVFAIGALFGFVRAWAFTLAGHRIVARLRRQLFVSVVEQEIGFFDQARTGELTSRLTSDCQVIQNAVTVNVSMLARYTLQILGSIVILIILSWQLSLIMFSVVPIIAIGAVAYGRFIQKMQKKFQDALADATTVAEEVISNVRVVRSFSKERHSQQQYGDAIFRSYDIGRIIAFAYGVFGGIFAFIPTTAIVLILWYGGLLVISGEMTIGLLTSFLFYTLSVAMAFAFLSSLFGDFMQAVGASERIFQLLDRKPAINVRGGKTLPSLKGNIAFEKVMFSYPTRSDLQVLSDVDLTLSPGTILALVGPSGGGKSTIVALLERFYDVTAGSVSIDGVDIRELDPEWLRQHVALVSQEPVLFATTIRENICYGVSRSVSDDEIKAAAIAANAHPFISDFPSGYKTAVGERGIRLSGGQKQRIAIARALLMDPRILLLDEATSALDAESEFLVQEAIDRLMQNRTVLVIAHRLSTVKNADKIAVLSGGRIIESGSHDELLEKDGLYKKLVNRQLQGHSLDEAFKEIEKEALSASNTPQPSLSAT